MYFAVQISTGRVNRVVILTLSVVTVDCSVRRNRRCFDTTYRRLFSSILLKSLVKNTFSNSVKIFKTGLQLINLSKYRFH